MPITVKFFARLREELGQDEVSIDIHDVSTVLNVWQQATRQSTLPAQILMAVNQTYVKADTQVRDGDEVAFFPPVTGG